MLLRDRSCSQRHENSLELSEAEFDRCLYRLGASHPPLRKRFFKVRLEKIHHGQYNSAPAAGAKDQRRLRALLKRTCPFNTST